MTIITGFAADALRSLSPSQVVFLESLPKAELHAHLNGSIPLPVLCELAAEYTHGDSITAAAQVIAGLGRLQEGVEFNEIHEFFALFPAIYALTSTPSALGRATQAVLHQFLGTSAPASRPQCDYLELRTTPRQTHAMTRREYVLAVLDEVERYPPDKAAVIVSLDRRMEDDVLAECVDIASSLKAQGRRVVGVDLCGDPLAGDVHMLVRHLKRAKRAGLGVTVHIAETAVNTQEDTMALLSCEPDRLGHATFLGNDAKDLVLAKGTCIEICLSSNLLCKTVTTLDDHHIWYYLQSDHPIAICTDDVLLFRNSLLGEYALLMAEPPRGLGMSTDRITRLAEMSMQGRFTRESVSVVA